MVAADSGVEYAPLFYKPLEKVKDSQLTLNRGKFDNLMKVPSNIKPLINWWIDNLPIQCKEVTHGHPKVVLYSDASKLGWGGVNKTDQVKTGGQWSESEQSSHINILELKACKLTLTSLCKNIQNTHIRIYMDNTTSCSYVNKFGGKMTELNELAREIWFWCLDRKIHLSAAHVPGVCNEEADEMSRKFNDDLEWSLDSTVFNEIKSIYPAIDIDLFASRLNFKTDKYISLRPEPQACAIDAFSTVWNDHLFYIFPPFSLIPRILQKLEQDGGEAVLVAPIWSTQVWWASLLQLISGNCYQLPSPQKILQLPHKPTLKHPLTKMKLGVFRVSGTRSKPEEFRKKPLTSLCTPGKNPQKSNTIVTLNNGGLFAKDKILTPFFPL